MGMKKDYSNCMRYMDRSVQLVDQLEDSWSAKASIYAYHGRLCLSLGEFEKGRESIKKQILSRQIDRTNKPADYHAPALHLFEPNMYVVSALGKLC